ncbi:MAG: hypothetical protein LBI45_02045 [Bacteroidales bacterium]|jgi:transcriptional regulator with XRE-family HTH domain|nr:hypothetical protein [Bacteroidales bacterium]
MRKTRLRKLHLGDMIKRVANIKGVATKDIAAALNRSTSNASKILWHDDLDIEDIIRISCLLKYNFLFFIVNDYLLHIAKPDDDRETETCLLKVDMNSRKIYCNEYESNINYIKNIWIGKYIQATAHNKNWCGREVANRLKCIAAMVSYLYQSKSLKVKKLIEISEAFQYDFISNVYLFRINISNSLNFLDECVIDVSKNKIQILDPINNTCMEYYRQNDAKKLILEK